MTMITNIQCCSLTLIFTVAIVLRISGYYKRQLVVNATLSTNNDNATQFFLALTGELSRQHPFSLFQINGSGWLAFFYFAKIMQTFFFLLLLFSLFFFFSAYSLSSHSMQIVLILLLVICPLVVLSFSVCLFVCLVFLSRPNSIAMVLYWS